VAQTCSVCCRSSELAGTPEHMYARARLLGSSDYSYTAWSRAERSTCIGLAEDDLETSEINDKCEVFVVVEIKNCSSRTQPSIPHAPMTLSGI